MKQCQLLDFIGFARADKHRGIRRFSVTGEAVHRRQTRGQRQLRQFIQFFIEMRCAEIHTNKQSCGGS